MANEKFLIRPAQLTDCAEITRLAAELGYSSSPEEMRGRLERLADSSTDVVFVAATGQDTLAGWVHGHLAQFLESELRVEIAGLVVDAKTHRQGIGRALVAAVEKWAAERQVSGMVVRCRTTRPEAHLFYESLGYARYKTQVVFKKSLQ
jgi:GNAT superfamily N-acetyltransferase